MAHGAEDCATVLEHFVHDAANLPAEIQHLMEEIQAKDKIMQECRATINSRDGSIQKFIKANGSLAPNVKEEQYSKQVIENLDRSYQLQDEKIKLSDRACVLLDRQIKRLDDRIRVLVNEGLLSNDPPLPSLSDTNQKNNPYRTLPRVFSDSNVAESTPGSDRKHPKSAEKENPIVEAARNLVNRTGGAGPNGFPSDIQVTARASAPGTPSGLTSAHSQQDKEKGVDNKRLLRLGQQPIGSSSSRPGSRPGTPKPGTPVPSRAGSVPPRVTAVGQKPPKIAPHHKVKQLKAASLGKRRKPSPSAGKRVKKVKRSPNGEGEEDDDSLLSSADMSDSDKSDTAGGDDDMDDDDEDEGIEDTKVYCTCRNVSHGDMVACDNDDCPYEWFHWKCVGLTREPTGTWYCDECRKSMVK